MTTPQATPLQGLPPVAHIGFGQVHHARTRPSQHRFTYGTFFLMLPMRLEAAAAPPAPEPPGAPTPDWHANRPGPLSFFDEDHGLGLRQAQGGALPWLQDMLHAQGIADADGDVWLQTYPRVWGYTFKPVSFWYCYRARAQGGALRAVVAEVNNTFGERHCYVLDAPAWGQTVTADKVFHVSPFCEVKGSYRFCFTQETQASRPVLSARIDHHDEAGLLIHTRLTGTLQPLDRATSRRALWAYPLMTLGVFWRIHREAFSLWRKRVPYFTKPSPPPVGATLSHPVPAGPSSATERTRT
jgi:hypothetical protein